MGAGLGARPLGSGDIRGDSSRQRAQTPVGIMFWGFCLVFGLGCK